MFEAKITCYLCGWEGLPQERLSFRRCPNCSHPFFRSGVYPQELETLAAEQGFLRKASCGGAILVHKNHGVVKIGRSNVVDDYLAFYAHLVERGLEPKEN